ncbi:hypothetical protein GOBAR_DD14580 [Gossypium barbadense]|nr:hypothetical protein GOBAR_DD14580 [Gossypium barbadense]
MLRRVGKDVKEKWIIGGDFNAILENAEKKGGRRKPKALMEDFRKIIDEFSMVDLKTDNGWFTWVNNREETAMVKERLDRFLMSANDVNSFPFMGTKVIRQSNSDHDAIFFDTEGRKSRDNFRDPRLSFKYEACWAKNKIAKNIIKEAWQRGSQDTLEKIKRMGQELGGWQFKKLNQVNKDKSIIMFSPKTLESQKHLFSSMFGMRTVDKLDSYLGLPLPVSRKRSGAFSNIINRCTCRVKSWSKHLLSYSGKEVFIKAIMQAIPTYAFSIFLAPKGIIEDLQSQMSRMWWAHKENNRGWAMMAWEKLSPKGYGRAWLSGLAPL